MPKDAVGCAHRYAGLPATWKLAGLLDRDILAAKFEGAPRCFQRVDEDEIAVAIVSAEIGCLRRDRDSAGRWNDSK